jgi:hypothetical protein
MGWQDAPVIQSQGWQAAPVVNESSPAAKSESKGPTLGEQVLSTPAARVAMGVATPFVGALQLGANVGDYINKKMGVEPVVSKALSDWWGKMQAARDRGLAATQPSYEKQLGITPTDFSGFAGSMIPGVGAVSKAATVGQKIIEGAKVGAAMGAAQPGTQSLGQQAAGGVVGGVLSGAAPVAIPQVAKAAGWAWDAAQGRLIQVKAGKVLQELAGDQLDAIKLALDKANPNLTAAQAVQEAGITAPAIQAMGARASEITPNLATAYTKKAAADEAGRVSTIQKVTPDLAKAEENLQLGSNVAYGNARAADSQRLNNLAAQQQNANMLAGTVGPMGPETLTPALQALKGNPVIDAAVKEARTLAKTKNIDLGDPMSTLEGLHFMKVAIDNQFGNRTASTALQKYSDDALRSTKSRLLSAIEEVSPLYGVARQQHAALSEPVNQAKVLNAMQEVLKGPSGTERAKPFLNVLGQGENALLKKADQNPRFGGLEDVLTPEQMAAVNKVGAELTRDEQMAFLAGKGKPALARVLKEETTPGGRLPFMNAMSSIVNKVSGILQGAVSDKTKETVAKSMMTGATASELLSTIPFKERSSVMKALIDSKMWDGKPSSMIGLASGDAVSNAMAPKRSENKNALRIE